jgi:hypothetical protein
VDLLLFAADDPGGLARGRFPAPAWVIWLVSAAVIVVAAGFLRRRARQGKTPPKGGR